jgi:hypothetical protein
MQSNEHNKWKDYYLKYSVSSLLNLSYILLTPSYPYSRNLLIYNSYLLSTDLIVIFNAVVVVLLTYLLND